MTLSPWEEEEEEEWGGVLKHARFRDEVRLTINHSNGRRGSGAFDGLAKALDLTALSNLLSERGASGALGSANRQSGQAPSWKPRPPGADYIGPW